MQSSLCGNTTCSFHSTVNFAGKVKSKPKWRKDFSLAAFVCWHAADTYLELRVEARLHDTAPLLEHGSHSVYWSSFLRLCFSFEEVVPPLGSLRTRNTSKSSHKLKICRFFTHSVPDCELHHFYLLHLSLSQEGPWPWAFFLWVGI